MMFEKSLSQANDVLAFVSVRVTRLCNEKQLIKYDKKIDLDSE